MFQAAQHRAVPRVARELRSAAVGRAGHGGRPPPTARCPGCHGRQLGQGSTCALHSNYRPAQDTEGRCLEKSVVAKLRAK